jgi:hypothetical protein
VVKLGQRIADYLNPDGLFSDADRARRRGVQLGPQGPDGMSRLTGLLDPQARAYFEAIEAAVRPGRHQPDEARDGRNPAQRCTRPGCLESGYRCEVHHAPDWALGGSTDADKLFFACGADHGMASRGELRTRVVDGRLAWTDGAGPPEVNHAHHPDELLRGDPDPPREAG